MRSFLAKTVAISVLCVACAVLYGCQEELPKGAIARVGTVLILESQLKELEAVYEAAGRAPRADKGSEEYRRFRQALAEYLVTQELLRQEASSLGVRVSDQEVQAEVGLIRQMFQNDEKKFAAALKDTGLTLEQLTRSIRDSLWLEKVKDEVTKQVAVSEAAAKAYYEAHRSDYVRPESRKVRHILISPFVVLTDGSRSRTASEAEWEAARVEAEKVRRELQNGANFISEAEKYSDDEATKDSGGELGAVTRGMLVPAFEDAVFSLKKGEISAPVRTQYGYHLIQVTDIVPEQQLAYEQVKEQIKTSLLEKRREEAWQRWLLEAETKVGVEYRAGYQPTWALSRSSGQSSGDKGASE